MTRRLLHFLVIAGVIVCAVLGGLGIRYSSRVQADFGDVREGFALVQPAFAQGFPAGRFPMSEAGISAYVKVNQSVDIAKARTFFRGIQAEGDGYLIGIVELPGLREELWPHLYVNKDGWFLAYYSKYDPASKLMPWNGYQGGPVATTTLRDALVQFTTQLFASMQMAFSFSASEKDLHYYDFRYPEARAFVLAVDVVLPNQEDSLRYAIPSAVMTYESSWAHYAEGVHGYDSTESKVDGSTLYKGGGGTYYASGLLGEQFLIKEKPHTASISQGRDGHSGIAIAFIYR